MKKYVVIFSVKPAVRLDPKLDNVRLNFYEQESLKQVIISKIEQRVSQDSKIQLGLRFRVFLYAKDLEEAREKQRTLLMHSPVL